MPAPVDPDLQERQLQVVVEQGARLRWQIVLVASAVGTIAWQAVAWPWVVGWALAAVLTRELRALRVGRLPGLKALPLDQRLRNLIAWNLLLGIVNGSAALFMLRLDTVFDALLTMLLVSWGSASVSTNAAFMPCFYAFSSPMFLLVAVLWAYQGQALGYGTAVLALMSFGVHIKFAKRVSETFAESFYIRRENLDLAQSLAAERQNLVAAKDAAEAANHAKSRFLASASHDLRQPMQALALNSATLARASAEPETQALAQEIAHSVDDLRTMLDGLLDLSQLDTGSVTVEHRQVDLCRLLEGLGGAFRASAEAKGLQLRVQCERRWAVDTDPELLRRALANLLDNAIKYCAAGEVVLQAQPTEQGLVIDVRDTGAGIAAQDQERIFDELVQLGNRERDRRRGYGLGLSIVRRLVGLLGLKLTLVSAVGEGTNFSVHVPADRITETPAGTPGKPAAEPGIRLAATTVLVLDDDLSIATAYRRILAAQGCRVLLAADGNQALAALTSEAVQLAIVDYRLADGDDGLSAIARMQQLRPDLPMLLCTADRTPALESAAAQLGARLLRKPLSETSLIEAVAGATTTSPSRR